VTGWPELVTAALLGTTRRPVPEQLLEPWAGPAAAPGTSDAVRLLELAARHRVVVRIGAARTGEQAGAGATGPRATAPSAPPQRRPTAPVPAVDLLTELLGRPDPTLIGYWLQSCVESDRTTAPVHWTPLARLAARSTQYDRGLLGRALGEQGRWFLQQNPDWRRLAADVATIHLYISEIELRVSTFNIPSDFSRNSRTAIFFLLTR
jgi:hypothetical protein